MKHQRESFKDRVAQGIRDKQMGLQVESEPLTKDAWLFISIFLGLGTLNGLFLGYIIWVVL